MIGEYNGIRPEQRLLKIDGVIQSLTHNNKVDGGLLRVYATTASLPAASSLPEGTPLVDAQASQLKIVVNGVYKSVALA